jgi:OPT family oligopeptide transporter
LVWPSEVIWPQNLPLIAVLRTLHERQSSVTEALYGTKKSSFKNRLMNNRLLFFFLITLIAFTYEWFPLYIMPILAYFSWMCWINPTNDPLAQLTAVRGLAIGGGGLTLDWSQVTQYLGSPLILPGWALINIAFGFVLIIWLIVPIVYGSNVRSFTTLPIGGVVSTDFTALSLVTAFTSFASVTAVFVHALLFHSVDIWQQFRTKSLGNMGNDMHARMISLYKTVPDWCYLELFALALIVACVTCDHAGWLSWYYVILSLFVGALFTLPFGLVSSITGQLLHNLSVYYIVLLIGQSLSLQKIPKEIYTFIALGYVVYVQTLALIQDMKLAHYIKISPRALFAAQCLAGLVCSTLSIGIRYMYVFKKKLTANNWSVFNNTKIGWTLLNDYNGFFSGTNVDNRDLLWAFLIGAFLPIPGWILSRFERFRWLNKLHWPLILVTIGWMPSIVPAGALFTWLVIGLSVYSTFGKYSWRQRHVYLVSAGLDFGLNITILIVNLALKNKNILFPQWWGNQNTTIYDSCQRAVQTW